MDGGMSSSLIDPTFLFRFEVNLKEQEVAWDESKGCALSPAFRLPCFSAMAGRTVFGDVRLAWSRAGIAVQVLVSGKRQLPWCRDSRLDESDGFHLWLDTRCSPGIHRGTRFCHRFLWMPAGSGPKRDRPMAALVPINRARSHPRPVGRGVIKVAAAARHDGYELSGFLPAAAMTGFDPTESPRLGIYYALMDREMGCQTLSLGPEYPVADDPSLWGQAVLVK